MNELSGGAPNGAAPQRIEAGPGGYGQDGDAYGGGDRDLKLGSVVRRVRRPLGSVVETIVVTTTTVTEGLQHRGLLVDVEGITMADTDKAVTALLQAVLHLGSDSKTRHLPHPADKATVTVDILVVMGTQVVATAAWELRQASVVVSVV